MDLEEGGLPIRTDSERLRIERKQDPRLARPVIPDTISFVKNLFYAWKKLHRVKKDQNLSHAMIGALFYEAMSELFDPQHRNAFLDMLSREKRAKCASSDQISTCELKELFPDLPDD